MAFAIAGSTALAIGLTAAGVGAAASGGMAIDANKRRKRRERELDEAAKASPIYKGSKPISDLYQESLNRYKESPYQSAQYQAGQRNIQRATAQGLGALQSRNAAIGGASRLAQTQADSLTNLGANAEAQKNVRFGQLASASQMKNADLMQQFNINKMDPYQRQLQLKQMKAQAANEEYATNVSNTMGNLSNAATIGMSAYGNSANPGAKTTRLGKLQKQYDLNNADIKRMLSTVPYIGE